MAVVGRGGGHPIPAISRAWGWACCSVLRLFSLEAFLNGSSVPEGNWRIDETTANVMFVDNFESHHLLMRPARAPSGPRGCGWGLWG